MFRPGKRGSANRFNTCSSCEEQRNRVDKTTTTTVSIHAPLARSNLWCIVAAEANLFQYMLLLRGATGYAPGFQARNCFNTCSSCEEQPRLTFSPSSTMGFNTCSSCEEQLFRILRTRNTFLFQYMLLLRGATERPDDAIALIRFQYMLLLRGATSSVSRKSKSAACFNTCSSCEEQLEGLAGRGAHDVSIHAPLARSNVALAGRAHHRFVSIHAPLARSNRSRCYGI